MTSEKEADNRHFAAELAEGNQNNKRREVDISFFVWNINEIDVVNQKFCVKFNIYASWDENVTNIHAHADATRYEKSDFTWDPQLRFINCYEKNDAEYETWYRIVSLTNLTNVKPSQLSEHKKVRVIYCQRVQGWFTEWFELNNFPFDLQHLHIGVTSSWDHNAVALSFDKRRLTRVSSSALTSQTWKLSSPRLMAYDTDWDPESLPLLTQSEDSATGARYCRVYLALTISRRPNFIMWNVMLIMTLVGFFSFAAYALDPSDLGDRQACVLTLVLTTVAYKYVTTSMMPEISYVTMMDVVIFAVMMLQAIMMLCICIAANIDDPDRRFDYTSATVLGVLWMGILIWFLARSFWLNRRRNRYIMTCDRKFRKTQYNIDGMKQVYYNAIAVPPQ